MELQKLCPKSAFWAAATSLLFLTALSRIAHGEVFLETGFEDSSGLPAGWTQSQISGSATWSVNQGGINGRNPSSAHSGTNNVRLFASNSDDSQTRLISPVFDTDGFINISLSFWHTQGTWFFSQDELKVFYSSDGGSTWTQLVHYTDNVPIWTPRKVAISTASANSRIAFEGNAKWGFGVCLDDIQVKGIPDTFSELSVSATDADTSEVGPDAGTWTIARSGNTAGPLSVNYILSGSAVEGSDYTVDLASPLSFAADETSKIVTLTPIDDTVGAEGDEVATLTLTAGTGYVVDTTFGGDSGDISIDDDEGFERNLLVIGSTHSFSEGDESGVVQEAPFNPSGMATQLQSILAQDPAISDTVNVAFQDIYKTKSQSVRYSGSSTRDFTSHCYSLAQHFMWPEGKAERLADLRGEEGTEWDTIVLCADPYILANFPGMYAEGVKLIQNEVAQSANPAQIVLLAQWPENSSSFSADDFNEVVHRVGDSAGLTVVPAGKAWDAYISQDSDSIHPTAKGAYLAAAAIYSKLFDRSAKTSDYDFPSDGDAIADHALSVVQANTGVAQYAGAYTSINPFLMKYVSKRVVNFRETGTSTEDRLRFALDRLDDVLRISLTTSGYSGASGTRWDFNYGRGNDYWEDDKDYEVDPGKYDRSYGFPMHHYTTSNAPITMPYGIDKHYWNGTTYEDGTDLGIAYNMIRPNTRELSLPEDVRAIPIRLMWLKMREISPGFNPLGDSTHMSPHLNDATAAFMYTLLSGRCPVVEEPVSEGSTEWMQWLGHKIGYETAWQMAHLSTRAPGFRVLPSAASATTVTPGTTETMTVQFVNPPQEDVTVTVSVSSPTAAIVSPKTLVFTPSNYDTPQEVTVAGIPGASGSEPFEVLFSTSSGDGVYDGLSDAWAYTNNRSSTTSVSQVDNGTIQVITPQYTAVDIALNVAGADAGNTTFAGPSHGSISWADTEDIQYSPSGDYLGSDHITYAVTVGGTQTLGTIELSVQLPDGQVNATAPDAEASEEGPDSGTFVISRLGDTAEDLIVFFTLGGTADFGDDYTLSHSSPVTIPAGQSSVSLTLTPVDDTVFGEREETVVLTLTEDSAYPIGIASATIIIADNDNRAPVVNAGPDQTAVLAGGTPWSPAETSTALWLDADDAATLILDGSSVVEWRDKSGNDRHATQASTESRPDLSAASLNSRDSLSFNGSSDFFDLGTGLDFVAGGSHSAFIVVDNVTGFSNIYGAADRNSGANSLHVGFRNSSEYRMNYWGHDWYGNINNYNANSPSLLNYAWEVGVPKQIFANGLSEGTGGNALAPGIPAGGGRISNVTGHGYFGGNIAEIVFLTGSVAVENRERMEGYLAHKWGIATSLPSGHPYKDQSPGGSSVQVNLSGTASDPDGETPTTLWTQVSGPGTAAFDDPSSVDAVATFTQTGTYVLRLTADDGYVQTHAELTITVSQSQDFATWISGYELGGQTAPGDDYDGDGIPNAVENYFGTHPGTFNAGLAVVQVTTGGEDTTFEFSHPINENPASDLTVTYRWSKDLATFHDDGTSDGVSTVSFVVGTPVEGEVPVTATVTGEQPERLFVTVEVMENQ